MLYKKDTVKTQSKQMQEDFCVTKCWELSTLGM